MHHVDSEGVTSRFSLSDVNPAMSSLSRFAFKRLRISPQARSRYVRQLRTSGCGSCLVFVLVLPVDEKIDSVIRAAAVIERRSREWVRSERFGRARLVRAAWR